MPAAYDSFVRRVRAALPEQFLTFNQLNGHRAGLEPASPPAARFVELWPPNHGWRHLEPLVQRSGGAGSVPAVMAIYPPPAWADRAGAVRTAVRTLAVACMLGADVMMLGDDSGLLPDPYHPHHVTLSPAERRQELCRHRFALSPRPLSPRGGHLVGGGHRPGRLGGDLFSGPCTLSPWARVFSSACAGARAGRRWAW